MLELKCQENARAIAQQIKSSGSGSDVTVTQVVESGTKIATIGVDDVSTDLYAPEVAVTQVLESGTKIATVTVGEVATDLYAPVVDTDIIYSGTEKKIGKWFGSDLYEITIDIGALPNTTTSSYTHGIDNIGKIFITCAFAERSDGVVFYCVPSVTQMYVSTSAISVTTSSDLSDYTHTYVTVRYTKTA